MEAYVVEEHLSAKRKMCSSIQENIVLLLLLAAMEDVSTDRSKRRITV
jgi:hypothetical protein